MYSFGYKPLVSIYLFYYYIIRFGSAKNYEILLKFMYEDYLSNVYRVTFDMLTLLLIYLPLYLILLRLISNLLDL
jgi:hypothetical protein